MYVEKTYAIELLPTKEDEDNYEYTTYIVGTYIGGLENSFVGFVVGKYKPVKLWQNVFFYLILNFIAKV